MKKKLKTALAATLALLLALTVMPLSALPRFAAQAEVTPTWTVPNGYNVHDYTKCVEFLEQTDANGVKNGEKLSENYDPNDPETWGTNHFSWTSVNDEQRVRKIRIDDCNLCGSLDVSGCNALEHINCNSNSLTGVDVSNCTALVRLYCAYNNLAELDVSNNTALEELYCYNNNLTELDVSGNTALEVLSCDNNNLAELDVSNNTALDSLSCDNNNLAELDVSNNTALDSLSCDNNNLAELDVSNNTALYRLDCPNNNLAELDVSNNTALELLYCYNNSLAELDVSQNTALWCLFCYDNNLTELDVSNNTALERLACHNNNLTELDVSNNPLLPYDLIKAEGNGHVGYVFDPWNKLVTARPTNGASFDGFYDESGALLSEGTWSELYNCYVYIFEGTPTGTVIARFSGGEATVIDTIEILDFVEPAWGANPFFGVTVPDDAPYTIDHTDWNWYTDDAGDYMSSSDVFDNEEYAYYQYFQIVPDEGYVFANEVTVTINGDTAFFNYGGWTEEDGFFYIFTIDFFVSESASGILGDVDLDGEVTTADALMLLRSIMGLIELNEEQLVQAEVTGEGSVTIVDALLILRRAMEIISSFPAEE